MTTRRTLPKDPRKIGGTYRSGYWQQDYTVYARRGHVLTVEWDDGRITNHCTAWDTHRDQIISEPTEGLRP